MLGHLVAACTALLALSTPAQGAVERKAALKTQTAKAAKTYLHTVLPPGLVNTTRTYDLGDGDYELRPPSQRTDEWGLRAARKHFANDPAVLEKINDAEASEIARHLEQFQTFRPLSTSNPAEADAFRVSSLIFIKFKRDGRVTARLAACGNQQADDSYSESYASTSDHPTFACILSAYYAHAQSTNTTLIHDDFDITGAFLQCELPRSATGGKQLLMKLPDALNDSLSWQWFYVQCSPLHPR
jgi:hypothetical protein